MGDGDTTGAGFLVGKENPGLPGSLVEAVANPGSLVEEDAKIPFLVGLLNRDFLLSSSSSLSWTSGLTWLTEDETLITVKGILGALMLSPSLSEAPLGSLSFDEPKTLRGSSGRSEGGRFGRVNPLGAVLLKKKLFLGLVVVV